MFFIALLAASACAALPESGLVGQPAAAVVVTPMPNADRSLTCPDDFRLDMTTRVPECTRPGLKAVDGNPRASCYAALPLGPLAGLLTRSRPTRSCTRRTSTTIVRLEGINVGWSDAIVTATPDAGITITTLDDAAADALENPVVTACFPWACRLIKLEITAAAAPRIELRVTLPGKEYVGETLDLEARCRPS